MTPLQIFIIVMIACFTSAAVIGLLILFARWVGKKLEEKREREILIAKAERYRIEKYENYLDRFLEDKGIKRVK